MMNKGSYPTYYFIVLFQNPAFHLAFLEIFILLWIEDLAYVLDQWWDPIRVVFVNLARQGKKIIFGLGIADFDQTHI